MDGIIIILIVLGYIVNVLLARKLNRVIYDMNDFYYPIPWLWFVPLLPFVVFGITYVLEKWDIGYWIDNFKGKNW